LTQSDFYVKNLSTPASLRSGRGWPVSIGTSGRVGTEQPADFSGIGNEKAKRFFEIPEFRQYAIADGVYKVLFSSQTGIFPQLIKQQRMGQLLFPFAVEFS